MNPTSFCSSRGNWLSGDIPELETPVDLGPFSASLGQCGDAGCGGEGTELLLFCCGQVLQPTQAYIQPGLLMKIFFFFGVIWTCTCVPSGIATSAVVAGGRSPSSLACALLWYDVSRFSSLRLSLIFPVLMSTSSAPSKAKTLTLSPRGLNAYLFCGLLLSLSDFT